MTPAPHRVEEPEPAKERSGRSGFPAVMRRRSRAALVVTGVGATFALAAATGIAWASAGEQPSAAGVGSRAHAGGATQPEAARATSTSVDATDPASLASSAAHDGAASAAAPHPGATHGWRATLAALDAARSKAFAAANPALFNAVYASDAPALRRDRRALAQISDVGLRARGLHITASRVRVLGSTPDRVRLAVTDVMTPFALVDADGAVVEQRAGRGERSWTVVLVRVHASWRVYDVLRA